MTEYPCDYVVARYVPNPLREEAINIGVILRIPAMQFVGAQFADDLAARLKPRADEIEVEILGEYLSDLQSKIKSFGESTRGLFADSDVLSELYLKELWEKFSGKLQFTRPRGAVATEPTNELKRLFELFALPEEAPLAEVSAVKESLASSILAEFELRKLRPRIGTRYPVKVKKQQLVFSFGYRRVEGPKHEVVLEAVDLTAETFAQRVRALAPTSIKFEMAKSHRTTLEALCLLRLPGATASAANDGFELEIETLRRHADAVFNFDDASQRGRFLKKVEADLRQ